MEQKINIFSNLKQMPKGTVLYSPMVGKIFFDYLSENEDSVEAIWTENKVGEYSFDKYGRYTAEGEIMLFPSKQMRDWSKFAWKKGDVLKCKGFDVEVIFEAFTDSTYTSFTGRHYLDRTDMNNIIHAQVEKCLVTLDFVKEEDENAQDYIDTIEGLLGGKLNLETLEVEGIKPKWTPKPFEKVLVKSSDFLSKWECEIFSHKIGEYFICIGATYKICIPYNKKTAHLIGTTDNY